MGRKANKKQSSSDGGRHSKGASVSDQTMNEQKSFKKRDYSDPESSYVRNTYNLTSQQPYITTIISMENSQALDVAKDGSGARVIEAFLGSSASDKHKKKYSRRPEQWVSRQKSKLSFYKDFVADSGKAESKSLKRKNPPADNLKKAAQQNDIKLMRQEIDHVLSLSLTPDVSKKDKKQKKEGKDHGHAHVDGELSLDKKKRKHHLKDESSKKKLKT